MLRNLRHTFRRSLLVASAAALTATAACDRDGEAPVADTAGLGADLTAIRAGGMDTVSALERGAALVPAAPVATRSGTSGNSTARRSTTTRRTTTAASGEVSGGTTRSTQPATRTVVEKNTKRDAIIGAAAGAAIGAATSDNKAKGAIIGGVVGGVLGGVIGNNVDVKKKKVPATSP
jgi:outer membrane lipoprotein SlyB